MDQQSKHGVWGSSWTFILAATGSAVGLGNIWKFPYITGENGGGAFVLVYLLCIAALGIPVMVAEVLLGRNGRMSPVNTMRQAVVDAGAKPAWALIGWGGVIAGLLILSFYGVIAGWALKYVFTAAGGAFDGITGDGSNALFEGMLANKGELILWQTIFMLLTAAVVIGGVIKGLETAVRVLMPILFVLLLVLLGYSLMAGDFAAGVKFLFYPDFSKLTMESVLVALGHAFFTLSLGMGAIMAYGAYMPSNAPIGRTVLAVALLDTLVALVAGLAIFPIVFANPGIEASAGPGLLFVSLPVAFGSMPGGILFAIVFFVLVSIAAWSSAISLIEPAVAWMVDSDICNRFWATVILSFVTWLLGLGTVLSFNDWAEPEHHIFGMTFFDLIDFFTSSVVLPLGGMFIALFVGWVMLPSTVRQQLPEFSPRLYTVWMWIIRTLAPALVFLVFIMLLVDKFGA